MAAKVLPSSSPKYEEIEPFCTWQREEARETLIVHLADFKKDQLRVQINNHGILKISGERQINATKRCKFYKEVPVPKSCITDEIRAKFINGCLYISMPKQVLSSSTNHNAIIEEEENGPKNQTKNHASNESGHAEKETKLEGCKKIAINIAAVFVMLGALTGFFIYMFRATIIED